MSNRHGNFYVFSPLLCLATAFVGGIAVRLSPQAWWFFAGCGGLLWAFGIRSRRGRRRCLALLCVFVLGYLRVAMTQVPLGDDYRMALLHPQCFATLKLVIRDAPLREGALAELDAGRGGLEAQIFAIQTSFDNGFRNASGRVALLPAYEVRQEMRDLRPGTGLLAQGVLMPLQSDGSQESSFGGFLRSRGLFHQFEVDSYEIIEPPPLGAAFRLRLWFREIRAHVANRLVRNVESKDAARLLLALGLGMGEFIPRETRERQMVSGTVHAFAISGMHIGMAALLFAFLLRWSGLPLTAQRIALGVLTAGYVLLTGASISSLRALWMVLLALYAAARSRPAAWLNALGCAALVALTLNPWQLLDLGFLYSHLTVMVLLTSAPAIQFHARLLCERDHFLPRELRHRRRTALTKWFIGSLEASVVAWLGTLGISLHFNARLSCGAFLLNLPLGILVAAVLALCPVRLLLGVLFPGADGCWAKCLALLMQLAEAVAESGYASGFEFTVPLWSLRGAVIYYIIFFVSIIYIYFKTPRG